MNIASIIVARMLLRGIFKVLKDNVRFNQVRAAGAYLATEKSFRRIMGHEQLWMLKSYLDQNEETATVAATRKVG